MKKSILSAIGLAFAAFGLAGCQTETDHGDNAGELRTQTISIPSRMAAPATRTTMEGDKASGFGTEWIDADKLGVYSYNSEVVSSYALTRNANFGITSIEGGAATFRGEITWDGFYRTWELYAYYPRVAFSYDATMATSYKAVPLTISKTQTMPANGTHDPGNDYMVAMPGTRLVIDAGNAYDSYRVLDEFTFRYLVGFVNLSVGDITAAGVSADEAVTGVKIVGESDSGPAPQLSGNFNLDLTDGAMEFTTTSNEVSVSLPAGLTLGELDAWMVVNPFAADRLTFSITTENRTISKTIDAEALRGRFDIAAGEIKTFNMAIDEECAIEEARPIELVRADYRGPQGSSVPDTHAYALRFYDYDPSGDDLNGFQLDVIVVAAQEPDTTREADDLPADTYEFTTASEANTVYNHQYLTYVMIVENGMTMRQVLISGGTMTVEGDHTNYRIEFDITRADGQRLWAEYNGPLDLPNRDYIVPAVDFGTLSHIARAEYGANPYGQGYDIWLLSAAPDADVYNRNEDGWIVHLQFNTQTDSAAGIPDGDYSFVYSPMVAGTVLQGYESGGIRGSWLVRNEGGREAVRYPLLSGVVSSAYVDGEYTIEVDAVSNNGTTVTGTIQGAPSM
ncbi:MAG: hypothetical protein LBV18_03205 [Alistipes sp.]|jgi:hypothetical protein|nr:hypothetical protein [Alistipes sp.]